MHKWLSVNLGIVNRIHVRVLSVADTYRYSFSLYGKFDEETGAEKSYLVLMKRLA